MDNLQPTASPKLWTTLNEILAHGPCGQNPAEDGSLYGFLLLKQNLGESYGDDTPITVLQILEYNGLDDALWVLRCGMDERFARHLACDFAEHVLPIYEAKYPGDNRARNAIDVSRRFADGNATEEEFQDAWDAAGDAAWDAAGDAARDAARTAAWAAWDDATDAAWATARVAARAAARAAELEWQAQRLRERYEEFANV